MLARIANRYLQPEIARFISACCLGVFGAIGVSLFAAHLSGTQPRMLQLFGGDYPQFYMIGILQGECGTSKLYDLELQDRILHRIAPAFPEGSHLPFVYPPFVAVGFRPLARLPFAGSFGLWLIISTSAYAAALALLFRSCGAIPRSDVVTAWLVALSFEPFAFECCLGGQLSTMGCLGVAVALTCRRSGRPIVAGFALASLAYKPPLLVLILPMLLAGREWRMLAGFVGGVLGLILVSLAYAGTGPCRDFLGLMAAYGRVGGSTGSMWNTAKYVDLGAFLKQWGAPAAPARIVALAASVPAAIVLAVAWYRAAGKSQSARDLAWAATLCWTSAGNIYGPIYDVMIAVPGLFVAANAIRHRHPERWPTAFAAILAGLYLAAMVAPTMAIRLGSQVLTIPLICAGAYLTRASLKASPP